MLDMRVRVLYPFWHLIFRVRSRHERVSMCYSKGDIFEELKRTCTSKLIVIASAELGGS